MQEKFGIILAGMYNMIIDFCVHLAHTVRQQQSLGILPCIRDDIQIDCCLCHLPDTETTTKTQMATTIQFSQPGGKNLASF